MTLPDRYPDLAPGVSRRVIDTTGGRVRVIEQRAPSAATQTLQWSSPGIPQTFDWNADQAFRLGYIANVIAYRCVQIIVNAIAAVPLVAGRDRRRTADTNPNARISQLLGPPPGGPAPKLSARKLIRWTLAQQIVTGRRAWEIETVGRRKDGEIAAFWPLVAARLRPEPTTGGDEWFRVFSYGPESKPRPLRPDQVFYGWDPSGLDFRQAESPLQAARYDLSLVNLCDRYSIGFLRNNAVPATVVTTTRFADDDQRDAFRGQWAGEFGGPDNAGKTHFHEVDDEGDGPVGESIDVKVLGLSQKDARLIEQRKEAMLEVAMSLGVPWSKLDASGRTYDNADVEDRTFWEERLLPLMEDFADDVNMQLAPRLGPEIVWFDLTQVRALRPARRFVDLSTVPDLLDRKVILPNEVRDDIDLGPVEWGDQPVETPAPPSAIEPPAPLALPAATEETDRAVEPEPRSAVPEPEPPAPAPAAPEHREAPTPDTRDALTPEEQEQRRARIWATADAVVRTLESQWERRFRGLFDRQADATVARLEGKRGRQMFRPEEGTAAGGGSRHEHRDPAEPIDPSIVFDPVHWRAQTREMAAELYELVSAAGGARLTAQFGIAFDLEAPYIREFVEARANQLAGQVTDTTYRAITDTLVDGVADGDSIPDLARRIRAVFTDATSRRSTVIARTEVISAANGSSALMAAQLGPDVVAGQEWIATRDGRTREDHVDADGQLVAIGAAFSVGGHAMAYPGDPNGPASQTVQCRCTTAFLTPEEWEAAMAARAALSERRAPLSVLAAMLPLLPTGDQFDVSVARRAFQEVAA